MYVHWIFITKVTSVFHSFFFLFIFRDIMSMYFCELYTRKSSHHLLKILFSSFLLLVFLSFIYFFHLFCRRFRRFILKIKFIGNILLWNITFWYFQSWFIHHCFQLSSVREQMKWALKGRKEIKNIDEKYAFKRQIENSNKQFFFISQNKS